MDSSIEIEAEPTSKYPRPARVRDVAVTAYRWSRTFGVDPINFVKAVRETPRFLSNQREFKSRANGQRITLRPHLQDRAAEAGACTGHYFWQDLIVAQRIHELNPPRHVDVGSRIDGFVTHLLTFREVEVIDIRSLQSPISGLKFTQGDATTLDNIPDASICSLSSLHAIEHFGLGRYGDPIDPDGHIKGLRSLERVLAPGGRLWVSAPVGSPAVHFNGQRIIHPELPIRAMPMLDLVKFTAIPAVGAPVVEADRERLLQEKDWCGLYEFRKNEY